MSAILLNLSGLPRYDQDHKIVKTLPFVFENLKVKYPIFDTGGDPDRTIKILNKLYKDGYRIFIGFSTSTSLSQVIPWFQSHPNAIGISLTSTSPSLNVDKNVYRLSPPDNMVVKWYKKFASGYEKIIILEQQGDVFSETLSKLLVQNLPNSRKYIYNKNTVRSIFEQYIGTKTLVISLIVNEKLEYIKMVSQLPSNLIFDHIDNINETPSNINYPTLNNKYYFLSFDPPAERMIREIVQLKGIQNVSLLAWDAIQMAIQLSKTKDLGNIVGAYGYLYFDKNKDRNYDIFTVWKYNNGWKPLLGYGIDPIRGNYEIKYI